MSSVIICYHLGTALIRQSSSQVPQRLAQCVKHNNNYIYQQYYYGCCRPRRGLSTLPTPQSNQYKYLWQNDENNNAEAYMRTTSGYNCSFADLDKPLERTLHPAVESFIQASLDSSHEPVSSMKNKLIVDGIFQNLKTLNDQELLRVIYHLRYFAPVGNVVDPNYMQVWSTLDAECVSRMSTWSLDFLFQVADAWYGIKLVRFSNFHKKLILTCLKKCGRLKKQHFIRLMYCLNLTRTLPNSMSKYEIQDYLRTTVDKMNHHEISIVAMACFKTEMTMTDSTIVEKLLNIAISNKKLMDSISVSAVSKFARFTSSPKIKPVLFRFQEEFVSELDRLSLQACTHLALTGTKTQLPHRPMINGVVKIIENNITKARLKDLERIALVLTMFDVDGDKLCQLIVEELRSVTSKRANEMKEYGRCLPAILHYLSIREIFPHDLIDCVLSQKFRETYYQNASEIYLRELMCLDFSVELEVEGYTGARLDKETRNLICKSHTARVGQHVGPKVSAYEMSLRKVANMLKQFCDGLEYFDIFNVLPQHHCRKVVFCTDATGKPILIPDHFRSFLDYQIKYLNGSSENIRFHVIYTCNRNDYISSEKRLTGSGKMIVRQLTKMGYHVHVVFPPFTISKISDVLHNLTN